MDQNIQTQREAVGLVVHLQREQLGTDGGGEGAGTLRAAAGTGLAAWTWGRTGRRVHFPEPKLYNQ